MMRFNLSDDHGIRFNNGVKEDWPVGRMTDFIKGGGLETLALSAAAIDYLRRYL